MPLLLSKIAASAVTERQCIVTLDYCALYKYSYLVTYLYVIYYMLCLTVYVTEK